MAFVNGGKGSSAVKILPEFTFFWDKRYLLIINLWFSSKSHEHWFFWNVISYSCIYLKQIHSKNVTTEAIDRNSWILDADHWFSSKSHENCDFFEIFKAIPECILEKNSLKKCGYRGIRQKKLNFRCRSLVQFKVMWKLFFISNVKSYSCIFLKWIHSKNVATETLDRNSWILDADHSFTSKSREYCLFFEISIAIPVPIWYEFTPKTWLQRH